MTCSMVGSIKITRFMSTSSAVSAGQMEISRLRAELSRVKMERDILKKATAYFPKESE